METALCPYRLDSVVWELTLACCFAVSFFGVCLSEFPPLGWIGLQKCAGDQLNVRLYSLPLPPLRTTHRV